jgi:hypothetical protein
MIIKKSGYCAFFGVFRVVSGVGVSWFRTKLTKENKGHKGLF